MGELPRQSTPKALTRAAEEASARGDHGCAARLHADASVAYARRAIFAAKIAAVFAVIAIVVNILHAAGVLR